MAPTANSFDDFLRVGQPAPAATSFDAFLRKVDSGEPVSRPQAEEGDLAAAGPCNEQVERYYSQSSSNPPTRLNASPHIFGVPLSAILV